MAIPIFFLAKLITEDISVNGGIIEELRDIELDAQLLYLINKAIINGRNRLQEPLKKNEIDIVNVIEAIKKQECIKVRNYNPDPKNKHLEFISLGPSYLESQVSRAIEELIDNKLISSQAVEGLRASLGLSKRKPKREPEIPKVPETQLRA